MEALLNTNRKSCTAPSGPSSGVRSDTPTGSTSRTANSWSRSSSAISAREGVGAAGPGAAGRGPAGGEGGQLDGGEPVLAGPGRDAEQEALPHRDAEVAQRLELGFGLDALGHHAAAGQLHELGDP